MPELQPQLPPISRDDHNLLFQQQEALLRRLTEMTLTLSDDVLPTALAHISAIGAATDGLIELVLQDEQRESS